MTKLDLVEAAQRELGDVPAAELGAFIARHFRVHIEPAIIPVIRATLRHRELLQHYRREAKALVAEAQEA